MLIVVHIADPTARRLDHDNRIVVVRVIIINNTQPITIPFDITSNTALTLGCGCVPSSDAAANNVKYAPSNNTVAIIRPYVFNTVDCNIIV